MIDIFCTMVPPRIRAVDTLPLLFQGEISAHRFIVQPAESVSLAGCAIQGEFLRSDNRRIDLIGAVNGENAEVILTGACYETAGRAQLTVYAVQGGQAVVIYAAVGDVYPALGMGTAAQESSPLQPYPVNRMLADQNLRTWWIGGESASVSYYGAEITMDGNEITIHGTMTGDNSAGQDPDWEYPSEYYDDTLLDLTRQLKRMDKTDPLPLYLEPHHLYRYSAAVISGSMEYSEGDISGSVQSRVGVIPITVYGRHKMPAAWAETGTDLPPAAGEWRILRHQVSDSMIRELETLGIPYDVHGGSLALAMPDIRDGASVEFDHYKIGITLLDVTGLGGYTSYSGRVQHDELKY